MKIHAPVKQWPNHTEGSGQMTLPALPLLGHTMMGVAGRLSALSGTWQQGAFSLSIIGSGTQEEFHGTSGGYPCSFPGPALSLLSSLRVRLCDSHPAP